MKRFLVLGLFFLLGWQAFASGMAAPASDQRRKPPRRTVVVVHKGFPLRRPLRRVVIHPARLQVRVAPRLFLPVAFWTAVAASEAPLRSLLVWEDGETLSQDEDWTEFTLNCDNTGARLWVEIVAGRVQLDWAEVVFGNGEAQVVDMKEFERGPGHYELLDFKNGRQVDHVRMVARARSPEARVVLRMQK